MHRPKNRMIWASNMMLWHGTDGKGNIGIW
jgi:hypothetical protein